MFIKPDSDLYLQLRQIVLFLNHFDDLSFLESFKMSGTSTGKKAVLTLNEQQIDLPIYSGTLGPDVIDVKDILASRFFTNLCR